MVQKGTSLFVIDNSGASIVECIHVNRRPKKRSAHSGEIITVTVKRLRRSIPKKMVAKSKICFALVVSSSSSISRNDGTSLRGGSPTCTILSKDSRRGTTGNFPGNTSIASRFHGPVWHEVRNMGFSKIVALAKGVV